MKRGLELLPKLQEAAETKTTPDLTVKMLRMERTKTKEMSILQKLNDKEIKQPKQTTLDYYKIEWDEDKEKFNYKDDTNKAGYLPYV